MLMLVVLMAAAETISVVSIVPFLSVLTSPELIQSNRWLLAAYNHFAFEGVRSFILVLGSISVAIVLASSAYKVFTQNALNRFVQFQRHALSSRLLARYLHQPYEFFLTRNPSLLATNVLSEVDRLALDLLQPLAQLVAQGIVIAAMALLMFFYDPWTAFGAVGVLSILYGTIYTTVRRRLVMIGRERKEANVERYQACNEVLGGIKDVKVTHSSAGYLERFQQASRQFSRHTATNDTLSQTPLYMVEAAGYAGLIAVAMILLIRSNDVAQVLPALGLYGFAAYRMLPAAQIVYRGFAKLKFSSTSLKIIHNDLSLPQGPSGSGQDFPAPKGDIRLTNIHFAYPTDPDNPIFSGFSLSISENTFVRISGQSGSGKSTLVDILLGLIRPQTGTIQVGDVLINDSNILAWQNSIGYVPQNIYLADTTIAENIAFGVPLGDIDMSAVVRAATKAQLHDFVATELRLGYDTKVGHRGVRISGGQRQRIGIARALYRNPTVLVFDEATNALDAQTADAIEGEIRKLSTTKTVIFISHQASSDKPFDSTITLP